MWMCCTLIYIFMQCLEKEFIGYLKEWKESVESRPG